MTLTKDQSILERLRFKSTSKLLIDTCTINKSNVLSIRCLIGESLDFQDISKLLAEFPELIKEQSIITLCTVDLYFNLN